MPLIKNVCVYCGSSPGQDPVFAQAAVELGKAMVKAGAGLVYGGGSHGLMGIIAKTVASEGGRVTGIIPDFLSEKERMFKEASELIVVPDMHTRKRLMFERADAFVALPGGIGTLEELVEQLTWVQLERHDKPVLLADIGGFWRPLLDLLAHMRNNGFIRPDLEVRYQVAEKIADAMPMLTAAAERTAATKSPHKSLDSRL
ncbi:MAG: TIGR00730 family Rossman fold protein [Beijerinckiaceae bacterium]